jgi:hypothetical protein
MLARGGNRETLVKLGTIATAVAAVLVLIASAPAHAAFVFDNRWGYASIAENPFHDPTSGTLLEPTQVFPRGVIRDKVQDGFDVRMYVNVFRHGSGYPEAWHSVIEGDYQDKSFDAPLDIRPYQVSYLKYDFCQIHPTTHAVQTCEPAIRIGRPPPDTPPNETPPPADRDGDGINELTDCADNNATVWPGARDVPGNGIDEDCSGADQPGRLSAIVKHSWAWHGRRVQVEALRVREAPPDAQVVVLCRGKRCPFRVKRTRVSANGTAQLRKFFRRRLRAGVTIEVRILAPNMIGKVVRLPIKRGRIPDGITLCLPPGAKKPARC